MACFAEFRKEAKTCGNKTADITKVNEALAKCAKVNVIAKVEKGSTVCR